MESTTHWDEFCDAKLITRWNEFCDANSYSETIYTNKGLASVIKQYYGDYISPQQAADIVRNYANGSYEDGCRWWWIDSDGTFGGAHTVKGLPIDRQSLNAWCQEQGYETPWENEDE